MSEIKRLSPKQSRKVNALIRRKCCNFIDGRCILLDDGDECICPQLISYSLLCKWFRIAVLPADKELYAEIFNTDDRRKCTLCGASFVSGSNRAKYCPDCRVRIRRRQAAKRMRKLRSHVTL
ncbi:MAG: conjugal transfer protein [Ruminococcaceae bacterium]|nr:conjugal transfer protein [Oscillospiraceae bacterium]